MSPFPQWVRLMEKRGFNKTHRTRNDPRKEATRAAIIEAAESLFAESGIEGVSLRQIGAAAGSSNTGVVAYYFGNKATLVEEIFHYRLPAIDARRGELLLEVQRAGLDKDILELVRAMWQPLYEQVNDQGKHSYAGFMAALIRSDWGPSRVAVNDRYTFSVHVATLMSAALPEEVRPWFAERLNLSAVMVTGALQLMDLANAPGNENTDRRGSSDQWFEDVLRMVSAALLAPTGE